MKVGDNLKYNKYSNKFEILAEPKSKEWIRYSSNSFNTNKYNIIKEKISPMNIKVKIPKLININSINSKINSNNKCIESYSFKKEVGYVDKSKYDTQTHNLSGYKKILDKMIQEYSHDENSKNNVNNLVKDCIANQKYSKIKKNKIFSPILKKNILNDKRKNNLKTLYFTDDGRIRKKNEDFINKIIKIQTIWRGYILRKIVVKGLKKYYGLIYIYKLIKKYISKRNKDIFNILFNKKTKKTISNLNPLNNYLYTKKKLVYSNNINENNETNSFSFSTPNDFEKNNENKKLNENKIKTYYSTSTNKEIYNSYNSNFTIYDENMQKNRLTFYTNKKTNIYKNNINIISNKNNNKNCLIKKNYANGNMLYSNIIKVNGKNSKIGEKTSYFFNKYNEKKTDPISINTENCFKKPLFKKQNKKYVYVRKNFLQKDEKNFSTEKSSSQYNSNIISDNSYKFSHTLFNMYKFVFLKIIDIIKVKFYKLFFPKFLYHLKIKRKVKELKLRYLSLLSIIKIMKKTILKKYLNIFRDKILILKANDLIKNENSVKIDYNPINENSNKQNNKKILKTKIKSNIEIISDNSNSNTFALRNLVSNGTTKNISDKKDSLFKLIKIKKKYINIFILKYFNIWKSLIKPFNSKNNLILKKIDKIKINHNKMYLTINNENNNKIFVNKKLIKIKRGNNNHNKSANKDINDKSSSKEKKMRIIKRISNPVEYFPLYNSYNKNLKESFNQLHKNDNLKDEYNNKILHKIFFVIEKLESKKMLLKFFNFWKKMKK